jgi:hypothetical protein
MKSARGLREQYGKAAGKDSGCGCAPDCCGTAPEDAGCGADADSQGLGYSAEQTGAVRDGANLEMGCGTPQAIAALQTVGTVLDLGSGAGGRMSNDANSECRSG